MYLLVFITLVISLIGLYTQSFALQTARMMSSQTGFANAMLSWHSTALAVAHYSVDSGPSGTTPNFGGPTGCSLSNITGTGMPAKCLVSTTYSSAPAVIGGTMGGLPDCGTTTPPYTPPCSRSLPNGYIPYNFFSIAYQLSSPVQNYVITFVPPPAVTANCPISNFICLPGPTAPAASQVQIGISMTDLYNQIRNTTTPTLAYGTVDAGGFVETSGVSGTTAGNEQILKYFTPLAIGTGVPVPAGSIAIISTPDAPPCTGC